MGYRVINGKLYTIGNFPEYKESKVQNKLNTKDDSFKNILEKELTKGADFKISSHAAERMKAVNLNDNDMKIINEGINKAEEKGSKNSLILYKDIALVTSIENRTIITAVQKDRAKENIFTNVDSVVLL